MNYIVSDCIIRMKNAAMAKRKTVVLPYSRMTKSLCDVLIKEGYLASAAQEEREGHKAIVATMAYHRRNPVLTNVSVVSKPSLRIYVKKNEIYKKERKGLHTLVFSTSHGVMTGKEARQKGVGGELLFEVW